MATSKITVGIIGGSGLDDPKLLSDFQTTAPETPFGKPSSPLTTGRIGDVPVVILARHGKNHAIMPTKVPYRANLWALKEAGCTHILATTACGSLREEIKPGDFVFVDQFIDATKHRPLTLFEDKVMHTPMAEPFCPNLRQLAAQSAKKLSLPHHAQGTIVTIEGPRFSTRAESRMFRVWGGDVVNMSTVPEVILARELGVCYLAIAMATDYDCWKDDEPPVTWEIVLERMKKNVENVKRLLLDIIPNITAADHACHGATPLQTS